VVALGKDVPEGSKPKHSKNKQSISE